MHFLAIILLSTGLLTSAKNTVVRLSPEGALRPVEPSVAINPRNPNQLVAAGIRYGEPHENRVVSLRYHSQDGGKSWTIHPEADPLGRPQGDDAVTFNSEGRAYHSFIAIRGLRTNKPKANGIWVTRSKPNSEEWEKHALVVDHQNTLRPFEDKPYLVTDNAPGSPHKNNVYIAWSRFDGYASTDPNDSTQIYFARSADAGVTFETPFRISDSGGDCADDDYTVEGAVPAVGMDGTVHISWSGPRGLVYDRSLDGGKTFGKDRVLTELTGGWNLDIAGILRCNGFPVTKVDLSSGPHSGTVYINWVDERYGDPDVFLIYSRDKGETWSKPVRVNDDALFNGKAQFFTWLAVDPVDGSVNVVFYDRRNYDDTHTDIVLARSIDGGETFKNYKVDLPAFTCNKAIFFGDYTNIDAYNGKIVTIFQHFISRNNTAISVANFDFKPGTQTSVH